MASTSAQFIIDERPQECAIPVTTMMVAQNQGQPVDKLTPFETETCNKITEQLDRVCAKAKRWFHAEYFYSFIDKPYFMQNELIDPLESLGLPLEYNRKEWQLIRSAF
jgi:DIRP